MAFNRELSQFANYLALDASARYIGITTAVDANVGIGSVTPRSKLDVVGDAFISGITTSLGGFVGDLTGTASNATQAETLTGTPSVTVNTVTSSHINNSGVVTSTGGFVGNITGNVTGNVTGNADSATALQNARTIGGVSFDGTANIDLPGVNIAGNQDTSGNAASATALETARTIGGVSFDGTSNIDLPGVNTAGNQDTSGNAATATALETARSFTVSGDATTDSAQSFDGTGNVALPITLADSGVTAATYGGNGSVPVITVDAKGRVTSATTAAAGTALTVTADTGSEDIDLLTEGLAITGNGENVITTASGNAVDIELNPNVAITDLSATGVVTATSFKTGAAGAAIHVNTESITGPSSITIDPAAIGDGTGTVHILGNLQVEGTTTTIDSTNVSIADKNIQIATGAVNDAAADGGGITVDSGEGDKTFQFQAVGDNFGSSENMNLASGKVYKVNNTEVLSATTLGSGVVNSSLTSVGSLTNLDVAGTITGDNATLTGVVTATNFVATSGTMDVTGDLTGNVKGNVNGNLTGIADTAIALQTARDFSASGDATAPAVSFDGTGNVDLDLTLANTGVAAGTYGSGSQVSQITVDSKGRLTSATNVAISTSLQVSGGSGSGSVNLLVDGLQFIDGTYVNTSVAGTSVTIGLDASSNNTADHLVARDGSGDFSAGTISASLSGNVTGNLTGNVTGDVVGDVTGDLTGNADTATALQTARNFTVSGDATTDSAQSFDGTGNVALPITLANSGVSAATYGSASEVPIIQVDAKGRITSATTASVGGGLTVAGDSGLEDIDFLAETLTIVGGSNLNSNAASNGVTLNLDNDISIVTAAVSGVVTASGGFVGDLTGNSSSATALQTGRNFNVSGDATTDSPQSFDGTGDITLPITLADSGVSASTYGSGSEVPVLTVDSKGRITSATTASVGTGLTVTGDSGSEDIDLLSESLAITGGTNLTSSASNNGVEVSLDADVALTNLSATGVVTATSFHTGDAGTGLQVNSATITGPSSITLDPAAIGDNTGTVHILGNLQVEGTTTTIDSTTVNIADKNIQIATGAANDAAADGGGITVDSGEGDKTFQFEATGDNFGSSENMNLASGKVYKINNTEVLSSTTLGSGVVNSSLTSVGTLDSLDVAGALTGAHASLSGVATATGGFVGDLTGDVTGNVTGNVTGDLTGNVTGNVTGDVTGDLTGDVTGNVTGNLTGNVSGGIGTFTTSVNASQINESSTNAGITFGHEVLGGNATFSGTSTLTTVDINGGAIDGTAIGAASASTGAFTTLSASGGITGDLTGDVTGDVTGNLTGNINSAGLSTVTNLDVDGYIAVGGTFGDANQVLASVGAGVSWINIIDTMPQTRTTQSYTATAGQTQFSFNYNVNYLDVFVNGVKLTGSEFTATDGLTVTISEAPQAGEIVEFISYSVTGSGSGTVSSSNDLSDVTLTGPQNNDILVYDGSAFRNQQSLNLSGDIEAGSLTLSGNLTVNGTQTVLNTATLDVEDLNVTVAKGAADAAAADGAGLTVDGASATFQYASTGDKWVANKSIEASSFTGNLTGNVTGTASTATALETARNIGGVSFDGTADINLPGVNAAGNQDTSGNAATATRLETARTIGGVSFNGTSGINLPGVNQAGNQDTSGNAATATALQTARSIGGVSFNGTADINLPGVNAAGNQDTSGTAALAQGLTGTPDISVGAITATSFSGDGSGLTGVASTDNIQTATPAKFLNNVNVSGVTTLGGEIGVGGSIIPDTDQAYNLGSSEYQFHSMYVGPGSLYVNGQKVLQEDSSNIVVSADANQNLVMQTAGSGDLELDPTGTGVIQVKGTLQVEDGTNITNSAGNNVTFGNTIGVNALTTKDNDTNLSLSGQGTGKVVVNDALDVTGSLTVTGDLTVDGTTTTLNSTTLTIDDKNFVVASGAADAAAANGAGMTVDGANATFQYASSGDKWVANKTVEASSFIGNVTGNASGTASALATARNIGGVSFDGSADINLPGVNTAGNQDTSGNAASATALETARTIGGVSFDGTSNINLPGVNAAGNQDTSGNAASATALETARNIGGVSFDGTSDINLPGVNTAGNQNTTGTAAGLTGTPSITVNAINSSHINSTGIVTTTSLSGFDELSAPHSATTKEYTVTVVSKTAAHRYNGTGSGQGYAIDGIQSPFLTLTPGRTYRFNMSSAEMSSHPFRFYLDAARNTQYTTNVTTASTYTEITVTDSTPAVLHYQCSFHGYMGNAINCNSNTVNTPTVITGASGASITGTVTADTFVGDITGDVTGNVTGNADTASTLANARTIGGVSFDGSANINLPGVNAAGNQDTSGNAATATALETARTLAISGDASGSASFDGSANATISATLANSGVTAATYGSTTAVPVLTVDAKGRITSATTAAVGTALTVTGDSGSEDINLLSEGLAITGGTNLTSSAGSNGVEVSLDADVALTNLSASGVVTATSFHSATLTGPSSITIDPAAIGDNTGTVHILGNLQVEGTTTTIDSTTVNVTDKNIQVATGAANDAAADGGGITVNSGESNKTFQFEATGDNFGSSENMNLAPSKAYKINNVEMLSDSTLGSSVVNSSLTSVGTLGSLSVTGALTGSHANLSGVATATGGFVGDLTGDVTGNVTGDLTGDVTGNVTGNVTGDLTGNAATATILATARNIGGVSFDGSADINLPGVNAAGNQNTTGTSAGLTGTPSITVNAINSSHINSTGIVTATTFVGDVTGNVAGNSSTATALQNARTIGGVSFDGSANISLPGVDTAGNQDTSGNAATATALETARTIGGVSFDGSANISLPGVDTAGNQNTSGNAATATLATNASGLTGTPDINVGVVTATDLVLSGDLTVNGTTTTLNTATLTVEDKNITLASGAADSAAADGAGLTVAGASATFNYSHTGTKWVANKDIEAPNFNATSDITLKDNVSIIDNALEMINNLEGISWNWKDSGKASLGVSAQNVETVAPELVSNGTSHKAVNYNGLIGILIEAVKEQSNQISELRVELAKKANSRRKRK